MMFTRSQPDDQAIRNVSTWENFHRTAEADGPAIFKPGYRRQGDARGFASQGYGALLHHTDVLRDSLVPYDAWRG